MCEVTIVIPNYKGKEYLFSCVKSLYEKDQTEKKILIIDNASNDGSIEEVVKEIQRALIQSDVNIALVLYLSKKIKKRALEE